MPEFKSPKHEARVDLCSACRHKKTFLSVSLAIDGGANARVVMRRDSGPVGAHEKRLSKVNNSHVWDYCSARRLYTTPFYIHFGRPLCFVIKCPTYPRSRCVCDAMQMCTYQQCFRSQSQKCTEPLTLDARVAKQTWSFPHTPLPWMHYAIIKKQLKLQFLLDATGSNRKFWRLIEKNNK